MIFALTRLQVLFFVLQVLLVLFSPISIVSVEYLLLAVLMVMLFLLQNWLIFERPLYKVISAAGKFEYFSVSALLAIGVGMIYSVINQIEYPLPLSSLQDINNLGIAYKIACTILPVLAICTFESNLKLQFRVLTFSSCTIVSGLMSVFVLSKMPLAPYFLYVLYCALIGKVPLRNLITMGLVLIVPVFAVYNLRAGPWGEESNIFSLIVYRVPLLIEMQNVVAWSLNNHPMLDLNFFDVPLKITKEVFKGDEYTGIAPSYIGFFVVQFGFFAGCFLSLIFSISIARLLNYFNRSNFIDKAIYYTWSVEFFHFILDGSVTFYTSTNSGAFFWALLLLSVMRMSMHILLGGKKLNYI